jgi:hypothetical protein
MVDTPYTSILRIFYSLFMFYLLYLFIKFFYIV